MSTRLLAILLVLSLVPLSLPGTTAMAPTFVAQQVRSLAAAHDSQGQLWAAWEADNGSDVEIYVSRRDGGAWSEPEPVHARPDAWDRSPSLAIATPPGSQPQAWLAWTSSPRSDPSHRDLMVSRWAAGAWTEPQAVPIGAVTRVDSPALAAAPDGTLWLAWTAFDGVDTDAYASHWNGQAWSAPWQVSSDDGRTHRNDYRPQLMVAGDGRPWLVWVGHQGGPDDDIYASHWTGAGWTAEQMVNQDDDLLDTRPSLAIGPDGQPWLAWLGHVATGERSTGRILFARWDPSLSAWTPEQLASSALGLSVEEGSPSLTVDARGRVHLAWVANAGDATAAAHAYWTGSGWTEPQAVHTGVAADMLALDPGNGQVTALWLDQSGAPAPLAQAVVGAAAQPLAAWIDGQPIPEASPVDSIPNRYLGFGDSITWGEYNNHAWASYPARLDAKLDAHVRPSEVINSGEPGERTKQGALRIGGVVNEQQPKFVLIMEGTNDVTAHFDPGQVYTNLGDMIYNARHAGVEGVYLMLATIPPRLDGLNDETQTMNVDAIIAIADDRDYPLCRIYKAFEDYGNYPELYWDDVHPNGEGLQLMSDTWYNCILTSFSGVGAYEDVTPPTAVLNSVPAQTECFGGVAVSWSGIDNLNGTGVANFDVQVQVDAGPWTDWLMATTATSSVYSGLTWGHTYSFHVRARDVAGNVSDYTAPVSTQVKDSVAPYEAHVNPLLPVRLAPFAVRWGGSDACSGVATYDVQFKIDGGTWQPWLTGTPATNSKFNPGSPQYGHTYYFQARAHDYGGNTGSWSVSVSTILAQYTLSGSILTVREQPIAGPTASLSPAPLAIEPAPSGYRAYLAGPGVYDITAGHTAFGSLPPMLDVAANGNLGGVDFYLPPLDDAIAGGGFEAGNLGVWQISGTVTPALATTGHTGAYSVQLGDVAGRSTLSQFVSPPLSLNLAASNLTLSFLTRLEQPGSPGSLQVVLSGAGPVTYSLPVQSDAWSHTWYDLDGLVTGPLTITFVVSGSPSILVDEISLGSALPGAYRAYLPLATRAW